MPQHIHELEVQQTIDPAKDVDGLHPLNVGMMVAANRRSRRPRRTGSSSSCSAPGSSSRAPRSCVVGYGDLVGAPLSIMLAQDSIRGNATVTCCHVKTHDLAEHTRRADILVAAAGRPRARSPADMIKPGATVIDVGVHRTDEGLVGDVAFDEARRSPARSRRSPAASVR